MPGPWRSCWMPCGRVSAGLAPPRASGPRAGSGRPPRSMGSRAAREGAPPTRPTAPLTVLELGSGGGNSAFHLKAHFAMTLVDLSPRMLLVSRKLNPECEHIRGDIRTLRLGRTFDAVFVHDAICHMTTEPDLRAVLQTAA